MNLKVGPRGTHTQNQEDAEDTREPAEAGKEPPRDKHEREEKGCADHCVTAREGVTGSDAQPLEQVRAQTPHEHLRRQVEAQRPRHAQRQKHCCPSSGPPQPEGDDQADRSQHIDGAGDVKEQGCSRQQGGAVRVQPGEDGRVERDGLLVVNLVGQFGENVQQDQEKTPIEEGRPRRERKASGSGRPPNCRSPEQDQAGTA